MKALTAALFALVALLSACGSDDAKPAAQEAPAAKTTPREAATQDEASRICEAAQENPAADVAGTPNFSISTPEGDVTCVLPE